MTRAKGALAIDGGKSGMRVTIQELGRRWHGESSGTFYSGGSGDVDAIVSAVRAALIASDFPHQIESVCAGLSGLPADPKAFAQLRTGLARLTEAARIILVEDCVIAHYGALAGPGTVVSAGTGTVVLAVGATGATCRQDGWGPLLGDRGSGFDIGRTGLTAAWAAIDGVAGSTLLTESLRQQAGHHQMAEVQRFYGAPDLLARVSSFALCVFQAAQEGDDVAQRIIDRAAANLADSADAAARVLPEHPTTVSYAGRLFDAGAILLAPFEAELSKRGLVLQEPLGDGLSGALGIAVAAAGTSDWLGIYTELIESTPTTVAHT